MTPRRLQENQERASYSILINHTFIAPLTPAVHFAFYDPFKVWHMDRPGEVLVLGVEGQLPPSAVVRVNRPASLIAVSTTGCALHVLADAPGFELLAQPLPPAMAR